MQTRKRNHLVASKSDNLNIIFGWRHTKFTCGNKQSGLKPKVTGVSRRFSKKKYSLMPWSRSPSFLHAVQVRRWIYLGLVLVGFGRFISEREIHLGARELDSEAALATIYSRVGFLMCLSRTKSWLPVPDGGSGSSRSLSDDVYHLTHSPEPSGRERLLVPVSTNLDSIYNLHRLN
jgi:hypothetical protein